MSKKVPLQTLAVIGLTVATMALAGQTKPDFSGTWKLDTAKTEPRVEMPGMQFPADPDTVTIQQTATEIVLDEGRGKRTFKLDGSDSSNPGMGGAPVVTQTKWQANALVTSGSFNAGEMGTIEFRNTRTLSDDGKVMTIEAWGKLPMGEGARKLVYVKAPPQ